MLSRFRSMRLLVIVLLSATLGVADDKTEKPKHEKSSKKRANRLLKEKSPYLQQHAYNPVDWYPWGKEAFEKAAKENKPVFLSIGYSTCHWCHVMERESFEDEKIAKFLNEHFVCVKVDREERPDVDGVYMDFVQAMNQRGGWPLSAFLTPKGKPFFGGTYFPPDTFLQLVGRVHEVWGAQRGKLEKQADNIATHLQGVAGRFLREGKLAANVCDGVFDYLDQAFDVEQGGFSGPPRWAPKFPRTSNLDFLLRYAKRTGNSKAAEMVYTTLDHMIRGGIQDHLAGGFHRYSTDREWLLPHFEKMLYDNALISRTLLGAYRFSGRRRYLDVAKSTLDYVLTRMTDPAGGFRSAEDADTNHLEGLTYIWSRAEVLEILGKEDGELFCAFYGVEAEGNFEEERPDPEFPEHQNVLHESTTDIPSFAKAHELSVEDLHKKLAASRAKLLVVRDKRPQPFRDDKILVEWNGMMISALSHAFQVTGEEKYLTAAQRSASFIEKTMIEKGRLRRRFKDGEVRIDGFLEDHAFYIDGLLDLYESDFDRRWLELARKLGKDMISSFWDKKNGAFFSSAEHHEDLILRRKEFYDGAVPSGNSVAFLDLLRLHELTQDKAFVEPIAKFKQIACCGACLCIGIVRCLVGGLARRFDPNWTKVQRKCDDSATKAMLADVRRRFLPGKVVLYAPTGEAADGMKELAPLLESKLAIGGRPTAFVCRQQVCQLPARDPDALTKQLDTATAPKKKAKEPAKPGLLDQAK